MTNLDQALTDAIMAGDSIRAQEIMREMDREALRAVDRFAAKEADEMDAGFAVDPETAAALIADAIQAEAEFLAAIARSDAEYARRARHDLRPGQRIGNR